MTNCPPTYQNIQCESFGDRRKITSQLLRQFCKNDAYLKEQIDLLWDTTDPETRKRFYPPDYMDIENSFGIGDKSLSVTEKADFNQSDKVYNFNTIDRVKYIFDLDFGNDYVSDIYNDTSITQCVDINADKLLDFDNNYGLARLELVHDEDISTLRPPLSIGSYEEIIHHDDVYETVTQTTTKKQKYKTKIKKKEVLGKSKKDAHFYGAYNNWHCNCHWYNGFDRTKNYNIKSKWKKDPYGEDKTIVKKYGRIPSVCHAQTFKAQSSGRVSKVSLHIQGSKGAVSPCVVEIRTTNKSGTLTEKVLAHTEKKFSGDDVVAFEFKTKAEVKKGKTYAIVVRSPFSHFEKCYRIGGWTTGCFSSASKYYGDGSSYTSMDNGHSWKKNGKTKDTKSYGAHYYDWGINQPPVDFAFEVYVQKISKKAVKEKVPAVKKSKKVTTKKTTKKVLTKKAYDETHTWQYIYFQQGQYYLHLRPIRCNPIDWFNVEANYLASDGTVTDGSRYWAWEYYSPKEQEWIEIPNNMIDFDNNNTNYTVLKLRCRCDITKNTFGGVLTRDNDIVSQSENTILDDLISDGTCITDTGLDFLKDFKVTIGCYKPSKAYLRTKYYTPSHTDMLGASLWSEVSASAKTFGDAEVFIDIIQEKQNTEHIRFYTLSLLEDTKKQLNSQTGEYEYVQPVKDTYMTNQQIDFFEEINNLILSYNPSSARTYLMGEDMINYILNDDGFVEWCKTLPTPVYFLPYDDRTFFDKVKLNEIPSYPLIGGDIGDDDIIINPEGFTVPDPYGFVYNLPKSIDGMVNRLIVTYKTGATIVMDDNTEEDDDEGNPVNPQDIQEHVEEELVGIHLDEEYTSTGIYVNNTPSLGLKTGMFKPNSTDLHPSSDIDYGVTSDGLAIVFNSYSKRINQLFPNLYDITPTTPSANAPITAVALSSSVTPYAFATTNTLNSDVSVEDFQLVVDLSAKSYQEFIDFEVDYDEGEIDFYNQGVLVHGDFRITYNPLWVRGLTINDFPLKMDLWKERYIVEEESVTKQGFNKETASWVGLKSFDKTNINPSTKEKDLTNSYYTFRTTVPPRDNIRKLVLNEGLTGETILEEDKQYFVDYLNNTITLYTNKVNVNDTLTIHYTPNLTDNGLALGYRLSRPRYYGDEIVEEGDGRYLSAQPSDKDDVWLGMNYFTYRT